MDDLTLLLVEDEPDLREAVGEYLEAFGFQVTQAATAQEALAAASRSCPRLVLTDLTLPDLRGDAFLETFHSRFPGCLLYVHSGDSSFVPSPYLRAAGLTPDHVFCKPADLGNLAAKLRSDLGCGKRG